MSAESPHGTKNAPPHRDRSHGWHFPNFAEGMCSMCDQWVWLLGGADAGKAVRHWRTDILGILNAAAGGVVSVPEPEAE